MESVIVTEDDLLTRAPLLGCIPQRVLGTNGLPASRTTVGLPSKIIHRRGVPGKTIIRVKVAVEDG